jgi:AcrR family transcriptional regulator
MGAPNTATAVRLLEAAVESFAEVGYHATTTRRIAARAKMSPAAVYVHYKSKLQLLKLISKMGHERARETLEAALAIEGSDEERMRAAIYAFARWHVDNQTTARVVQYEYRHLPSRDREGIRRLRRRMQADVAEVIAQGVASGEFNTPDAAGASLAIVSMCVDLARWYSEKETRSPDEIGELYSQIALKILGC